MLQEELAEIQKADRDNRGYRHSIQKLIEKLQNNHHYTTKKTNGSNKPNRRLTKNDDSDDSDDSDDDMM